MPDKSEKQPAHKVILAKLSHFCFQRKLQEEKPEPTINDALILAQHEGAIHVLNEILREMVVPKDELPAVIAELEKISTEFNSGWTAITADQLRESQT